MTADKNSERLRNLHAFAESFRGVFSRIEHLRWFAVYLWGLMETEGRRSLEAIARNLPHDAIREGASPAQALQHFLSRSLWDHHRLLLEIHAQLGIVGEPNSTWVIHEAVFLKRGRQSVGVHRQYLRDHGLKANSQTAVMISQTGPSGYVPLALQLYLPRGWLEHARSSQLEEIPEELRQPLGKEVIARQLLAKLFERGVKPTAIALTNGFAASMELVQFIKEQSIALSSQPSAVDEAIAGREWLTANLGLDHFEGRSWRGWHHHAASVLAAYAYLVTQNKHLRFTTGASELRPSKPNASQSSPLVIAK